MFCIIYSKNYKNTLTGRKFKMFRKSPYFKKVINYAKHYKRFLKIQKRIKKKITFRINYFLLKKAFFSIKRLKEKKALKKKMKKKIKKKLKTKLTIQEKKKNNINKKRKSLFIKYNKKLINIDLKIFKFIKKK